MNDLNMTKTREIKENKFLKFAIPVGLELVYYGERYNVYPNTPTV